MSLAHCDPPSSACPSRERLEAFHLGQLTENMLEALAEHIVACAECSSFLEPLQRGHTSDTLLDQLRQCADDSAVLQESGYARLEAAARALPLGANPPGAETLAESNSAPVALPGTATDTVNAAVPYQRPLPAVIGTYEVLAQLGEGGMGVVYKARQPALQRLVALKMISAGPHASKQALARFRIEGKAIARLRHPHVVQIYDFGDHDGLPFYAMELLEGGSLSDRLAQGPLEPHAAAALVQTLAEAVAYAHQENVVHRDLKPGNILLTEASEPKIADFGLAKLLDSDDGHTRSEVAMGTPSYMAPEQAAGRSASVGPAADVYALGAILYQTLTSQPPFRGADRAETLRLVREQEPVPPSQQRREVPRVLEAICLKCLKKDPARRYESAAVLADELGRWRRGEPTRVRPPRLPVRVSRWLRRSAVILGVFVALYACIQVVQYWRDPRRIEEQIENELARGMPVTLLGETGAPRWYELRAGSSSTQIDAKDEDCFSVHSWSLCLYDRGCIKMFGRSLPSIRAVWYGSN
jgi:serine/threonine-protein kinase